MTKLGVGPSCKNLVRVRSWRSQPPPGCTTPKMWRFAELRHMTQTKRKQAMQVDEMLHWTQRAHKNCIWLQRWENQRRLSSLYTVNNTS